LISGIDGTVVLLGDIARVRDDVRDADAMVRFDGNPAGFIDISRVGDQDIHTIGDAVEALIAEQLAPALPDGVEIVVWNNDSALYKRDVGTLRTNLSYGRIWCTGPFWSGDVPLV